MNTEGRTISPRQSQYVVSGKFDDDLMLFHQLSKQYYVLNTVAIRIWQLCDGKHDVSKIAAVLKNEFDVPAEQLYADVSQTVDGFVELGLLEV